MDSAIDWLRMVERVAYLLPELMALFIAIYCIGRRTGTDTILMIVGAVLDVLTSIASIVLWEVLFDSSEGYDSIEVLNKAINYTGLFARLLFFAGVFVFVLQKLPPRRPPG